MEVVGVEEVVEVVVVHSMLGDKQVHMLVGYKLGHKALVEVVEVEGAYSIVVDKLEHKQVGCIEEHMALLVVGPLEEVVELGCSIVVGMKVAHTV